MRQTIVLGAGMVGVSTALALQERGHEVMLVDRKAPGQETSFGNAGIIQVESVQPYAMPRSMRELFDIATGRTNDVYYSFRELPAHVSSLLRYWWNSQEGRHDAISRSYATLIGNAIRTHDKLIRQSGADNLIQREGYRTLYRDRAKFDEAIRKAERIGREFGTKFRVVESADVLKEEPAFQNAGVGSIHWLEPWTVSSPGSLVEAYARTFLANGGRFLKGNAETLSRTTKGWSVETEDGIVEAPDVVVALGIWARDLLQKFGARFPMVLKRGYHAHYRSITPLRLTTMDTANGYVMAPMQAGTRITTGAHLTKPGTPPVYRQLERAEKAANTLMPLGPRVEDVPWSGTRPCMPDMLPVIGPLKTAPGLWLNFGHGHQGFTLGPASAELLASMMVGETPEIDPAPFSPARYG